MQQRYEKVLNLHELLLVGGSPGGIEYGIAAADPVSTWNAETKQCFADPGFGRKDGIRLGGNLKRVLQIANRLRENAKLVEFASEDERIAFQFAVDSLTAIAELR